MAVRRRSISRDSSRATRLPASLYADYILRLQDTEPESLEINAAPSARRITTRRRLAGGVRQTGAQRPSARGAISARVPPSSPRRHARSTRQPRHTPLRKHTTRQAHTSQWTRRGTLERGQDDQPSLDLRRCISSPTSSPPSQPTIHRCAPQPGRPPRMRRSFSRPCRCAREAGAHAAGARARGRVRAMSAPAPARLRRLRARREARRPLRWPSARASERAASPVLLTACALLPRCRQPQMRAVGLHGHRALDISTTGRRDVDTTVTRIRPSSCPRALPLGPGGTKPLL